MPTRIDPEALAPDPDFDSIRGPAIDPALLTGERLRARFADAAALAGQPSWIEQGGDGSLFFPGRALRPAAVLIGVVQREQGAQLLLTRRSARLADHAGQISFPGGRIEPADGGPVGAALREAHEEIGLDPRWVDVLGILPPYRTISGFEVTPVVAAVDARAAFRADPLEVEECFEVPLAFLMDSANHQRLVVEQGGQRRTVYAMEYKAQRRYFIWGATAAMLRNLYRFLLAGAEEPAAGGAGRAESLQSGP
jgi:8-oxo-dGTP pyrophosphatase MutT (NUDIX family)